MGKNGLLCTNARRKMTGNMRHKIQQSNEGRLQERRDRLQNALEQRRQAEVAEASTSTQTFGPQEDAEKKQFEALERKKEIKVQSAKKGRTQKMSRAQIREDAVAKTEVPLVPWEENVNRVEAETAKGQLISKCLFGVIVWSKIATKIL